MYVCIDRQNPHSATPSTHSPIYYTPPPPQNAMKTIPLLARVNSDPKTQTTITPSASHSFPLSPRTREQTYLQKPLHEIPRRFHRRVLLLPEILQHVRELFPVIERFLHWGIPRGAVSQGFFFFFQMVQRTSVRLTSFCFRFLNWGK